MAGYGYPYGWPGQQPMPPQFPEGAPAPAPPLPTELPPPLPDGQPSPAAPQTGYGGVPQAPMQQHFGVPQVPYAMQTAIPPGFVAQPGSYGYTNPGMPPGMPPMFPGQPAYGYPPAAYAQQPYGAQVPQQGYAQPPPPVPVYWDGQQWVTVPPQQPVQTPASAVPAQWHQGAVGGLPQQGAQQQAWPSAAAPPAVGSAPAPTPPEDIASRLQPLVVRCKADLVLVACPREPLRP